MIIFQNIRFSFSHFYDLVTIGPFANTINSIVHKKFDPSLCTSLSVQQQSKLIQPTLYQSGNTKINLHLRQGKQDWQIGVGLRQIIPEKNKIILKNGKEYYYRTLVYSGEPQQWRDFSYLQKLTNKDDLKLRKMFGEYDGENMDNIYHKQGGEIVFIIPQQRHFGYDNYFMMHLNSVISQQHFHSQLKFQIKIFNSGKSLFPFHSQKIDSIFRQKGINLVHDCQISSIDLRRRKIKVNGTEQNFDAVFHYQPVRTPSALTQSGIDPFQIDKQTLNHKTFQNIYFLGNLVDNAYSFDSMKKMSRVIADNIIRDILKIRVRSKYDGSSKIALWTGNKTLLMLDTDSTGLRRQYGKSFPLDTVLALRRRLGYRWEVLNYLKGSVVEQKGEIRKFRNINLMMR